MAETDSEDRTQAPTAQRLIKAREEGNVAQSKELQSLAALSFSMIALMIWGKSGVMNFFAAMSAIMAHSGDHALDPEAMRHYLIYAGMAGFFLVLPVAGGAAVGVALVGLLQTGFLVRPEALLPDLSRISPLKGIGRIAGGETLMEGVKSVLKFVAFAIVCFVLTRRLMMSIGTAARFGLLDLVENIFTESMRAFLLLIAMQVVIAVLDAFWVHWRRLSKLRMSRQEQKDEFRQTEGDPLVKNRLRQIRMRASRQRMMKAVPTATVIVANPTHYAVALLYHQGSGKAPSIVAKGMDDVARRIREIAQDNRIPIVTNPPLARALFMLPLDSEIPHEHFKVVAGIIAYVWKLRKPASSGAPVM